MKAVEGTDTIPNRWEKHADRESRPSMDVLHFHRLQYEDCLIALSVDMSTFDEVESCREAYRRALAGQVQRDL